LHPHPVALNPAGDEMVASTQNVYIGVDTLHSVVNHWVIRISLSLLYTRDYWTWAAAVFHEAIEKFMPRPSTQVLMLTEVSSELCDNTMPRMTTSTCASYSPTRFWSAPSVPPPAHSNDVAKWLHELVSLHSTFFTTYASNSYLNEKSPGLTSPGMGIQYACTGITPPQFQHDEDCIPLFPNRISNPHQYLLCL